MSISHSVSRLLSAAAVACSVLIASAPTQAAVIGSFDPAFGPSIPNLGFRGTITLDVAPGCYQLGGGFFFTGGNCQITPLASTINFYNASTNPSNVLTTVSLDASYFASGYVFGVYFDPTTGQLAGIDTEDSNPFAFSVTDSDANFPINYNGSMVLYFESDEEPIDIAGVFATADATQPGVGGAFLRNCTAERPDCVGAASNPASLTFTTVPEPDGIALALLGLGALVVARRRQPIAH